MKTDHIMPSMPTFKPGFRDTKVVLKRLKEYSGKWLEAPDEFFVKGKPSKEEITDQICKNLSNTTEVYVDADFDVLEVSLQDYAQCCGI